jgi:lipoyl(octanoyl) transferase
MQFDVEDLGTMRYAEAWAYQREVHSQVAAGERRPALLFVEHLPVVTLGRNTGDRYLRRPREWYTRNGIDLHQVERGGDVTFHNPGQLVGYPIFPVGRQVRDLFHRLEQVMIQVANSYGIQAHPRERLAGVWYGNDKLCAMGVAVRNRVALHGFALNVHNNLQGFESIVPCGIAKTGTTSLAAILGREPGMDDVKRRVLDTFRTTFDDWAPATASRERSCPA